MAYPNHQLITFGGTLGSPTAPVETWSCGIRTVALNPVEGANDPEVLSVAECYEILDDTILPALDVMWDTTSLSITSAAKLNYVKYNQIGPDGKYVHSSTVERSMANQPGANTTSQQHPFSVSLAVTLHSDSARGLASKGRIYLPSPSLAVDPNTGRITGSVVPIADAVATFLSAVRETDVSLGGLNIVPVIATKIVRSGQPTWRSIERVSVDNVLDTQRRRSRNITRARSYAQNPVT